MFGPDESKGEEQQVAILGRMLEWTEDGITYEADPRHVEMLVRDLKVDGMKTVVTPGVKEEPKASEQEEKFDDLLEDPSEIKAYRAGAARLSI